MKRSLLFRTIKKTIVEFITVFAVTLAATAVVTLLWNFIGYDQSTADWETIPRFAIIFGIVLTWIKLREAKEK